MKKFRLFSDFKSTWFSRASWFILVVSMILLMEGCSREKVSPKTGIISATILDSSDAGLVSYPPSGDVVAYSKTGADGFFDIYTIKLDGSNKQCLTCNSDLTRNNAHPRWHASMNYIAFEGEKPNNTIKSHPGFGWYYDLWALRVSDGKFFLLRDAAAAHPGTQLTGVLHPHFTHDGKKITWSELRGTFSNWQNYAIMVADFVESPTPHLSNIQEVYDPAYGLVEVQGFSFSNDKIVFAGNIDQGQSSATLDIYYIEINADNTLKKAPVAVSKSNDEWAEAAKFFPGDSKIIFSTTKTFPIYPDNPDVFTWRKSEYWIANVDGSNPVRLSYFMEPGSIGYMAPKSDAADFDISPDGKEMIATVSANEKLYLVKIGLNIIN